MWLMLANHFFPHKNKVPIARGSCGVIRMECEKSGFLIGPLYHVTQILDSDWLGAIPTPIYH